MFALGLIGLLSHVYLVGLAWHVRSRFGSPLALGMVLSALVIRAIGSARVLWLITTTDDGHTLAEGMAWGAIVTLLFSIGITVNLIELGTFKKIRNGDAAC